MVRAEKMVTDYVAAGFTKIHLDASMPCGGDPAKLDEQTVAERAARLAAAAEAASRRAGRQPPAYIIGSEVPVPGGAAHGLSDLEITRPESVLATLETHRRAFASGGITSSFARVVALVVQPGVEFDHQRVVDYQRVMAGGLSRTLSEEPAIVFEAHSTDYQSQAALSALVNDGFAILKVGPALTFAMREALYGLDHIALETDPSWESSALRPQMERIMLAEPKYWLDYYRGGPDEQRVLRHYSYSDRIRYYWPTEDAKAAVSRLLAKLSHTITAYLQPWKVTTPRRQCKRRWPPNEPQFLLRSQPSRKPPFCITIEQMTFAEVKAETHDSPSKNFGWPGNCALSICSPILTSTIVIAPSGSTS